MGTSISTDEGQGGGGVGTRKCKFLAGKGEKENKNFWTITSSCIVHLSY